MDVWLEADRLADNGSALLALFVADTHVFNNAVFARCQLRVYVERIETTR